MQELENHKLRRDEEGKLVKSILNLVACFYIDENLKDLFVFNEFSGTVEYSRDSIWHGVKKGQELRDKDLVFIQYYLAHNKSFEMPIQKITNAIVELSERKKYHPIRLYLDSLTWDEIPRLDEWLINTCKAEDNLYTRAVGAKYLMAAVARIYQPGIKFDNVLVFEGAENIGKSTVFRTLSEPWFCDSIDLMQKDKEIVEKMRGSWFLEVAEMFGVNDSNQERIKSFLTRQEDIQRLPYAVLTEKFKRQSVFCGSSNKMAYLFGEDGNRRFWPIKCEKIDIPWLKANKDQLFAEAIVRWRNGEQLFLNEELYGMAKRIQSQKLSVNEVWCEIIERYLIGRDEVTMAELLKECLKLEPKELHNRAYLINVGRILKKLEFVKKDRSPKFGERYVYVRESAIAEAEKKRLSEEDLSFAEELKSNPVTKEESNPFPLEVWDE